MIKREIKFGLLFGISLFFCSCQSNHDASNTNENNSDSTDIQNRFLILDTVLNGNTKVYAYGLYKSEEHTIQLSIKAPDFDTSYNLCEALKKRCFAGFDEHKVLWSTDSFIGLREGCGSPCYYEIVIPLKSGSPTSFMFPYTNHDKGVFLTPNMIAYNSNETTTMGYPIIVLRNLITEKEISIEVPNEWEPRVAMNDFIDTLYGAQDTLLIGQFDEKSNRMKYEYIITNPKGSISLSDLENNYASEELKLLLSVRKIAREFYDQDIQNRRTTSSVGILNKIRPYFGNDSRKVESCQTMVFFDEKMNVFSRQIRYWNVFGKRVCLDFKIKDSPAQTGPVIKQIKELENNNILEYSNGKYLFYFENHYFLFKNVGKGNEELTYTQFPSEAYAHKDSIIKYDSKFWL